MDNKDVQLIKTLAIGGLVIFGFSQIKDVIDKILGNTKDEKKGTSDIASEQAKGVKSPWDPNFWRNAQAAGNDVLIMTTLKADNFVADIFNSVGVISDNFPKVLGVFKQLKTQSQVSFLADRFRQYGQHSDLLSWLKGGYYPDDHFSDAEVGQIINYVNKLPKYKP